MSRQAKQTALVENQWKNWHFYLLFIALSFVFYGSTLKNKYAMDDDLVTTTYQYNEDGSRELISRHPNVEKGFSGIPSILTSHFAVNKKQRYGYRPVVTAVFAIEYQLFGSNPAISHFFNTLFYALVVILIFRFFRIAYPSGGRWFAAIVALLFLIHPLHSEVVNNIKSRDELLCLAFGLGAMINLLKYLDRKKLMFLIATLLLLLFSLLCKKTGMTFIPFLLLTAYYFRALRLGKLLVFFGSIVGVFLIWKLISKGMITESVAREKQFFENPLYFSQSFAERIPMYFYSNFYYLKLLLFPYPLRFYYGFNQVSIATWATPIVWFMAAFMVSLVSWIMLRMKKREVWGFGVLLFFFGIGGACNLLFPAVGIIAERFAFVASLGFCIVVASGLMYLFKIAESRKRMIGSISIGVLLIVSLTAVLSRNPAWSSRNSLYETDIVNLQESAKSHSLIAQLYASELKSLRGKLMGSQSQMNRRLVEEYNKKLQLTLHHFTRCIEIDTSYAVSYNNLGAMYFLYKADVDSSRMNFERALELDSDYVEANFNMGNTYFDECNEIGSFCRLFEKYSDSVQYSSSPPNDFLFRNMDLIESFAKFQKNIQKELIEVGKKSPDAESFVSNLTKALDQTVQSSNLKRMFNSDEFAKSLLKEVDQFEAMATEGVLLQFLTENLYENMSKALFLNLVKGKYNREGLRNHLWGVRDSLESVMVGHISKAIRYDSTYFPAYSKLSEYYLSNGKISDCIELNQKASLVDKFDNKYQFYTNIGNAYLRAKDIPSSIVYFELAAEGLQTHLNSVRQDKTLEKKIRRIQSSQIIGQLNKVCNSLMNLSEQMGDKVKAQKYKRLKESS